MQVDEKKSKNLQVLRTNLGTGRPATWRHAEAVGSVRWLSSRTNSCSRFVSAAGKAGGEGTNAADVIARGGTFGGAVYGRQKSQPKSAPLKIY